MLFGQGRIHDAAKALLEMRNTVNEDVRSDNLIVSWLSGESWCCVLIYSIQCQSLPSEFTRRCVTVLETHGDEASKAEKRDDAVVAYATALTLSPSNSVLMQWASILLIRSSTREVLDAAVEVYFLR